jgi:UDP-N-acetylglucosamine transferase subunit ALG13
MGTILSALRHSKPILVMPRKGALGETRNEHQLDTARRLHGMKTIHVAYDSGELVGALDRLDGLAPQDPIPPYAQDSLLRALNTFIHGGCVP